MNRRPLRSTRTDTLFPYTTLFRSGRRVAEVPARERRAGFPAGELTMAGARTPFPIPYGWFSIGYPEDFAAGAPRAIYYFDRHLVAWRDEAGDLHVPDAFCPHLGAHRSEERRVGQRCVRTGGSRGSPDH